MAQLGTERQGGRGGCDGGVKYASAVLCICACVELEHGSMSAASSQHIRAAIFAGDGFCPFSRVTRGIAPTRSLEQGGGFIG
jgi:hypothetical protein